MSYTPTARFCRCLALPVVVVGLSLHAQYRLHAEDLSADFAARGVPFLQAYCIDCHSGDAAEGDLTLDAIKTGNHLVKQRATAERILEMLEFGIMPPSDAEQPKPHEAETFAGRLLKLLDDADRRAPPDPGRVTMRRLNRTEYANTVRDLLGIDINPAEDFPADEVGYGFDNIGDVLSLSPLLMERYLTASEGIVERAFSREPPVPHQQISRSYETEPFGFDDETAMFRPIKSEREDDPAWSGPISVPYDVPLGEYRFRTRISAQAPAEQLVEVAVLACTEEWEDEPAARELIGQLCGNGWESLGPFRLMETIEVKSRDQLFAHDAIVKIPEIRGFNRIAIALYRPTEDEHDISVHVGWFTLDGPIVEKPCLFRQQVDRFAGQPAEERTENLIAWLLQRAFRRPSTAEEVGRYAGLVKQSQADGEEWEDGIAQALQAVLVSPKFLFRVELDSNPRSTDPRPIDEFQLASRLSYFLWSTMPDDELFALAEQGKLADNLDSQVQRMLADPRSDSLIDNFVMQWLQLQKLKFASPDQEQFPTFDDSLRSAMLEETRLFAEAVIGEDRSVLDFLGADFTFLNEPLARHYGIADTSVPIQGPRFRRVEFADDNRGGLLRQASILTATSNPTRTSPVKRGHWVLKQLLGKSPPPPPPDVPELDDADRELTGTLRERMEQHRSDPRCASCHTQMDAIGFAFENYDAIGSFRLLDEGEPIDATGTLPDGESFDGPGELIEILKGRRDQFVRALVENMLTYALGRGLESYDRRAVKQIDESMRHENDRFSALVQGIVHSEPFQLRRGQ